MNLEFPIRLMKINLNSLRNLLFAWFQSRLGGKCFKTFVNCLKTKIIYSALYFYSLFLQNVLKFSKILFFILGVGVKRVL